MKGFIPPLWNPFPELLPFFLDSAFTRCRRLASLLCDNPTRESRQDVEVSKDQYVNVYPLPYTRNAYLMSIANTYFMAIIATVGGMLFGFDISSMSAIVITEQYIDYFGNPSGVTQGAIGSALAAGSVIGSLMAGPISDKFGRRDRCVNFPSLPTCARGLNLTCRTALCLLASGG